MISFKEHHKYTDGFFQELCPEKDKYIDVYYDQEVIKCSKDNANKQIAMLLEPKSIIDDAYEYIAAHPDYFKYIFTHDSRLLRLNNAYELNWANVWLTTDSEKTKGISICTSYKDWCPLHTTRMMIANYYKDRPEVDTYFGDWIDGKPRFEAKDYLEHYKFSIVIENDIDEYWYTEKLLNCFATKTIPIYIGATRISERFNPDGIIQIKGNWTYIYNVVESMDVDAAYKYRKEAIEENFYRVVPYKISWRDRFIHKYGKMLEEMMNE